MSTSCQSLDKWLLNNTIIDLILTIKHTMRFKIENNKDDFKKKKKKKGSNLKIEGSLDVKIFGTHYFI